MEFDCDCNPYCPYALLWIDDQNAESIYAGSDERKAYYEDIGRQMSSYATNHAGSN